MDKQTARARARSVIDSNPGLYVTVSYRERGAAVVFFVPEHGTFVCESEEQFERQLRDLTTEQAILVGGRR